jgi:hypothetical protein
VNTFGGSGKDIVREIVTNTSGEIFITGTFSGNINLAGNSWSSTGNRDAFVAKFQSEGSLSWFRQFSPLEGEKMDSYGLCLDNAGNIYFTGYYTGDISLSTFNLNGTHEMNLFMAKLDGEGNIILAAAHSTPNPQELGLKVDTDDSGNIYVLASTDGTTAKEHPSAVIKYNPSGHVILDFYHAQNFCDMKVVGQNIYFTGTVNSPDSIGHSYFDPQSYSDAFVAKANTNMEFIWETMASHENTGMYSNASGLYVSSDMEIFITGYTNGEINWGGFSTYGYGGFLTKCTTDGEFLWVNANNIFDGENPVDITGQNTYVYVSCVRKNSNKISKVRSFRPLSGEYITYISSENNYGPIAVNPLDHKLMVGQDMNELISISKLDDLSMYTDWSVLFEGNSAQSHPIGMDVDNSGFTYQYGYTSNTIDYFGQEINKGLFLAKQDALGQPEWIVEFSDAEYIDAWMGVPIVYDTNTNSVYLASTISQPLVIPGGPTLIPHPAYRSFFILKYSSEGVFQWAIQEDVRSSVLSLATDQSGNVIIVGTFVGIAVIGNHYLTSVGSDDIFIAKYNSDGEPLWSKRAGGEDREYEGFVSTDTHDNIYLAGEYFSFDVTIGNYPVTMAEGAGNILLAKLDPYGNVQWTNVVGGCSTNPVADYYGWATGIRTDIHGNSYMKGWCYDSVSFGDIMLTSPINISNYDNKNNKFVAKFDTLGHVVWANSISNHLVSWDYNQFDIDDQGNIYCGLQAGDTTYFGSDFIYENMGSKDLLVYQYTNDGQLSWVRSVKDSDIGDAWITSVKVNENQTTSVSGYLNNYLNFGTSPIEVTNKSGFMGVLDKWNSIILYDKDANHLEFDVFPNPAEKWIQIHAKDNSSKITAYQLIDITGHEIDSYQQAGPTTKLKIDVSNLSSGMYFLKVYSGKLEEVKKIVIK